MSLDPIFNQTFATQFHMGAALMAVILGPFALWRKRRDAIHVLIGRIWVVAMTLLAISALWIPSAFMPGHFGPIHLFVPYTFWALWMGVAAARRGDIHTHRAQMRGTFFGAILFTGALTFLPGRVLNEVFFHEMPILGLVPIVGTLFVFGLSRMGLFQTRRRAL